MMSAFLMESSSVIVAVERLRGCEVEISHARATAPVHDLDNTVEWQGDATASLRGFRGDTVPPAFWAFWAGMLQHAHRKQRRSDRRVREQQLSESWL